MTSLLNALKQINARDGVAPKAQHVRDSGTPTSLATEESADAPPQPTAKAADGSQLLVGWHGIAAPGPCELDDAPAMPAQTDSDEPCPPLTRPPAHDDIPDQQRLSGQFDAEPDTGVGEVADAVSQPCYEPVEDEPAGDSVASNLDQPCETGEIATAPHTAAIDESTSLDTLAADPTVSGYGSQLQPIPKFETRLVPGDADLSGGDHTSVADAGGTGLSPPVDMDAPKSILEMLPADDCLADEFMAHEVTADEDHRLSEISPDLVGMSSAEDLSGDELLQEIEQLLREDQTEVTPPAEAPDDNAIAGLADGIPESPADVPGAGWSDEAPADSVDPTDASAIRPSDDILGPDEDEVLFGGVEATIDHPALYEESALESFAAAAEAAAAEDIPEQPLTDFADPDPLTTIDFSQAALSAELARDAEMEVLPTAAMKVAPEPADIAPGVRETTDFELEICDNLESAEARAEYEKLWSALCGAVSTRPSLWGRLRNFSFWSTGPIEPETKIRTVLLGGTESEPHVSLVLAHLAVYLTTHCRLRVLVVDGDLEVSTLSTSLGVGTHAPAGLAELCFGTIASPTVDKTASGLDLVSAGVAQTDSAAFQPDRITEFIASQKANYDIILVDGGACDGPLFQLLAAACDRTYLVARLGKTERRGAAGHVRHLLGSGINVCGCVVTNA